MATVGKSLTMEEFLALPWPAAGKLELLRGELIELPPSKFRHDDIADRILDRLKAAVDSAGL